MNAKHEWSKKFWLRHVLFEVKWIKRKTLWFDRGSDNTTRVDVKLGYFKVYHREHRAYFRRIILGRFLVRWFVSPYKGDALKMIKAGLTEENE